jgi:outer membrane protein insertion porin family
MKYLIRHGGLGLLLLLGWLPAATAQLGSADPLISKITITNIGPQMASDELVRGNIHVRVGDPYKRPSVDKDILNLYSTGFFRDIRVSENMTEKGVELTYILQGKLKLTGINFEGNTKFSNSKLLKKVKSKPGDPLDERKLFDDAQEMEKLYQKKGYPHTTVRYEQKNVDYETGKASVTFVIKETPKIKIVEVDFVGAKAFTQRKLRHVVKTRAHWMFSWLTGSGFLKDDVFEEDQDKLADFYRNAGYIDYELKGTNIIYPTPRTMKIQFDVFEGNRYRVGAVTFKGNKLFTTEQIIAGLKALHESKRSKAKIGPHSLEADVGLIFTPDALNNDIHSVEDFYGARGYIDVKQGPEDTLRITRIPNTETGTMDIEYQIEEGQKSYVEKIEIKGNVKTKDKVIRRELSVRPGDVFDMVQVQLSKKRVEGLDFFEKVDTKVETDPTLDSTHKNLIVGVEEKSTGSLTFGAGFNTVESLFGYAEVEQRNFDLFNPPYFTGAGQKFRLKVQLGLLSQDYEVSFVEPWFLNRKLTFEVDLYHQVQNYQSLNNLYDVTRTGARVSLSRPLLGNDNLVGGISGTVEEIGIVNVNTNAPTTILNEQGYSTLFRAGASLTYDTRNDVQLPNKGQQTSVSAELTEGDRYFYKVGATTAWYFKGFAEGHVLELVAKGGVAQRLGSSDVPFYDRYYLGGPDTLRGFDYRGVGPREVTQDGSQYEPIGGDTYWMGSAEYSVPIIDRLRFALFYDIGNVSANPWSNSGFPVNGRVFAPTGQVPVPPLFTLFGTPQVGNTRPFSDNYGFGIRLNLPIGPLRLDYGIPIHHDNFNSGGGKFQFGVGFRRPL